MKINHGDRFGKWTVIKQESDRITPSGQSRKQWLCKCDCGNSRIVQAENLTMGLSKSCGCEKETHLVGKRFGKLTVVDYLRKENGRKIWKCECECGNIVELSTKRLQGGTKSCGCLKGKIGAKSKGGRIYRILSGMKTRCYDQNSDAYKNYGGRGITICDEWIQDFWSFYNWALENGYKDGLTIDRIDNDKGYAPWNCRWATKAEQNRNKRPGGNFRKAVNNHG